MIVLSDYVVPKSGSYVSQCQHQVERYFERGRRFSLCPWCRRVGWTLKGSQYEIGIRANVGTGRPRRSANRVRPGPGREDRRRSADTLPPPGARPQLLPGRPAIRVLRRRVEVRLAQ